MLTDILSPDHALMLHPALIMLLLALTTLLLEDAALAAGIALAGVGTLSWPAAFIAVAGGIAIGDVLLYAMGHRARRLPRLRDRLTRDGRLVQASLLLRHRLGLAMVLARIIPGLRLVIYSGAGFLAAPLLPFTVWVVLCVIAWTGGLFWLGAGAGVLLSQHLDLPLWQVATILFATLMLIPLLLSRLTGRVLKRAE